MGKRKKGRDGFGTLRMASPDGAEAMVAWANLVGAIVETMRDAEVPTGVIHDLLDNLNAANAAVLEGSTRDFAFFVTGFCRDMLPSND